MQGEIRIDVKYLASTYGIKGDFKASLNRKMLILTPVPEEVQSDLERIRAIGLDKAIMEGD